MRLHGLVGFAKHGQATGRSADLHMVIPTSHLAIDMMLVSIGDFEGHFLTSVKKQVKVHRANVLVA